MRIIAKKCVALSLMLALCISVLPAIFLPVAAAGSGKLSMSSAEGRPGDLVQLDVQLTTNPGLVTMEIQVAFDDAVLELVKVEDAGLLKGSQLNPTYGTPYTIAWIDGTAEENNTATGVIAQFTFKIKSNATSGTTKVKLVCKASCDYVPEANDFSASGGQITIQSVFCQTHTFNEDPESLDDEAHTRNCAVCGYVEKQTHSYSVWQITEEDHTRSCALCGYVQSGDHEWDNGEVLEQATCQTGGRVKYTCKTCAASYEEQTDPATTHSYDHDCDVDCNVCGDVRVTEHVFDTELRKDKKGHWFECTQCGEKTELAEHIPGAEATEEAPQTCTECGFVIMLALNHQHETAQEWSSDLLGHWRVCSACEEQVDFADHVFENDCDADCALCGYVRQAPHAYPEGWLTDSKNHWRVCDICGEQILLAAHIPGAEATEEAPQNCTECGYELAPILQEKVSLDSLLIASYGWPWWANTIAVAVILGSIAALIIIPLGKKRK